MRCFSDQRRIGAIDCCRKRHSLCTMQLPEARFGPSVRWGLGAEWPSWLRGHGWSVGPEGLRVPNSASPPRTTRGEWVSGTGDPHQSSRAQGAGAAQPRFALWSGVGRGRKRLAGAVFGCPRKLSLCTMQLPVARFGPSVRRVLGAERPSRLKIHGCGLRPEGLRAHNPASPRRRTHQEWVSGIGDPQQSSRAEGARGIPAPLCPLESGGPGRKRLALLF